MNQADASGGQEAVGAPVEKRPSVALKKFAAIAETATSAAKVVEVIKQILESPSIYVFGELLDVATVQALRGTANEPYLALLNLFAYGTYSDYLHQKKMQPASLPDLSPVMLTKLRQLSIVSMSRSRRHIPYHVLLKELDLENIRQLEDLIIDVIYANIIQGSMDQQNHRLEIDQTIGRDVREEEDFSTITNVLAEWCQNCDNILSSIEHQMTSANRYKEESNVAKTVFENKIANVKKNLKTASESEDVVMTDVGFGNREQERGIMMEKGKRNSSSKFIKGIGGYKGGSKWRKDN